MNMTASDESKYFGDFTSKDLKEKFSMPTNKNKLLPCHRYSHQIDKHYLINDVTVRIFLSTNDRRNATYSPFAPISRK